MVWPPRIIEMTRLLIRLMICSSLGVITTVLVAWSLALGPDPRVPRVSNEPLTGSFRWDGDGPLWSIFLFQRHGSVVLASSSSPIDRRPTLEQLQTGTQVRSMTLLADEAIPHWSRFRRTLNDAERAELRTVCAEEAYGWPMLSLGLRAESDWPMWGTNFLLSNQPRPYRTVNAIVITPSTPILRRWDLLPFGIIWRGLLLDSGLYATIWGALSFVPRPLRHMIRRKRGRCIECGYNLLGDFEQGCPECGWRREGSDEPRI